MAIVLIVVIFAVWGVLTFAIAAPRLPNPWTIDGGGGFPLGESIRLPAEALVDTAHVRSRRTAVLLAGLVLVLVLLALLLVALLARWAWVSFLWSRLRRELASGDTRRRTIGAWTWLRMQRVRRDAPLPMSVSPDVALTSADPSVDFQVLAVAQVVAPVAFDDSAVVSEAVAEVAWTAVTASGRLPNG